MTAQSPTDPRLHFDGAQPLKRKRKAPRAQLGGMKPSPSRVGQRLRELRCKHQLRQSELGPLVGTTGGRVSEWELGHHLPTLQTLIRYSDVLGISVSEILRGVL